MLRFLPLALLCGCVTIHDPQPIETKFDESKRDWLATFEHEIRVAIENEDREAYHFFMQEYLQEKVRIWKLKNANKLDK